MVLIGLKRPVGDAHAAGIVALIHFTTNQLIEIFLDMAIEFLVELFDAEGVSDIVQCQHLLLA